MKQLMVRAALAASVALLLSTTVQAREQKLSDADQKFMMNAARGNMLEVQLGKLAATNGSSAEIKQFGQRMVKDHSAALEKLQEVATKYGVTLPKELNEKQQAHVQKFARLKGQEFDDAYAKDMLKDHQKDVAEFRDEAKAVQAPALKSWTTQTLPVLEDHLKMARSLKGAEK